MGSVLAFPLSQMRRWWYRKVDSDLSDLMSLIILSLVLED